MHYHSGTRSCTTMAATGKATRDGSVIFGKNSDRPINEAQPLCFFEAKDYGKGEEVQCSFIRIPQVSHTYACIGSKPHVFFGFEHGINEHGVMIGNEQVSGREAPERRWGLIGMDILRLAPVSYTHLDVYKRQGYSRAILRITESHWMERY